MKLISSASLSQQIDNLVAIPILADKGFKLFFQNKRNAQVFLRDVLQMPDLEVVAINSVDFDESARYKNGRLDIICKDSAGNLIDIEMQNADGQDTLERAMFYLYQLGRTQVHRNQPYTKMTKTIGIWVLNFDLPEHVHYHSEYAFQEKYGGHIIDKLGLHFLSLPKRRRYYQAHPSTATEFGIDLFLAKDTVIKEQLLDEADEERKEVLLAMCKVEEQIASVYEQRGIEKGIERGREEGREEGLAKGLETTARNMLLEGLDIALIAKVTGLDAGRIRQMQPGT